MPSAAARAFAIISRVRRLLDFTVVRIVIAVFTTALAGGLTAQFVSDHTRGLKLRRSLYDVTVRGRQPSPSVQAFAALLAKRLGT